MNLLILTQKIDLDDSSLGFFHQWVKEFSKNFEQIRVVCLEKRRYSLPQNVKVYSLGKELGISKILYIYNFYKYIWSERKKYDAVFVHMNPEYVILGGFLWKIFGKRVVFWYTHKNVDIKLRLAEKFTDVVLTASPEGFRLKSKKIHILGHGIDINRFSNIEKKDHIGINIVHVGRITPIKNLDTLINAVDILIRKSGKNISLFLVGEPITKSDFMYKELLQQKIEKYELNKHVVFVGKVSYDKLPKFYEQIDVAVNLAPTGGMDKAVLEAIVVKVPVFFANKAFERYCGVYSSDLIFEENNSEELAEKILIFLERKDKEEVLRYLFEVIEKENNLGNLIRAITIIIRNHETSR